MLRNGLDVTSGFQCKKIVSWSLRKKGENSLYNSATLKCKSILNFCTLTPTSRTQHHLVQPMKHATADQSHECLPILAPGILVLASLVPAILLCECFSQDFGVARGEATEQDPLALRSRGQATMGRQEPGSKTPQLCLLTASL